MATAEATPAPAGDAPKLKRGISKWMLLVFIVGDTLGGGIYALVGEVGAETGGAIWTAFLLAFIGAAFTAGSYAELISKYPRAGGAAYFVNKAFGLPLLSFLVTFAVMASGVMSASTLALGFGGDYFSAFVDADLVLVALIFIVIVAVVNFIGIVESMTLNIVFTAIEVTGLLMIVVIGIAAVASGEGDAGRVFEFASGDPVPLLILTGASLAFYALIGFEDSANMAEEVQDPRRTFPFVLFTGLAIAATIYVLVTVVASMAVDTAKLADSDGPLLEVVGLGPLSVDEKIFSGIALFALANGALINMIMASRLLYGMGVVRIVPRFFSRLSPRRTPWIAIIFTTALAMVLISTGDLESLARSTVVLLLFVFILVNIAVLVLRRQPVSESHFTIPTPIPIIGAVIAAALLTQEEPDSYLRAGIGLVIGLVLYGVTLLIERDGPVREVPEDAAPE